MGEYYYEDLKRIAREVRARMAEKGRLIEKRARRKPRDPEKRTLLLQRVIDRIKGYPPSKTEDGLVFPYFLEQPEIDRSNRKG